MKLKNYEQLEFILAHFDLYSVDFLTKIYFSIIERKLKFAITVETETIFRDLFFKKLRKASGEYVEN